MGRRWSKEKRGEEREILAEFLSGGKAKIFHIFGGRAEKAKILLYFCPGARFRSS
jgi:hypothetical protein